MKINQTLLALCLGSVGLVYGQTTTTSTTTTSSYSTVSPVDTIRASSTGTQSMAPGNTDSSTGAPMNTPSMNNSYNSTTTTTTTTSNDVNTGSKRDRNGDGRRDDGKQGRFGIYAGVNASQFVNEPIDDQSTGRVGYQIGLYGRTGGTVFGQIGAEFRASSTELFRRGDGQTISDARGKIDQYFLAIPVFVGVRAGGPLGLRIQAGPEFATLFAVGDNNFEFDNDDVNRIILNGVANVGINLGPLTLDVFYNRGFVNVFDRGADTKRQIIGANVGFRF